VSCQITLLRGAKVETQKMGPAKAEMLSDDTTPVPKKKNTEPPVQNGVQHMREEGVAIFRNLMFPHGSRVKTVNIRFSQEVPRTTAHAHAHRTRGICG
jgi:hypothetical protein